MTTIAWDGKTLAADSRITDESIIGSDNVDKLYKIHDIPYFGDILLYCGLSGVAADDQKYVAFIHEDKFYDNELEFSLGGIVIGIKYAYHIEQDNPYLVRFPRNEKMADGSGAPYARSAMHFRLTAIQAINHAKKFDSATGGKVKSVRL